jgi:hypothetical protein
VSGGKLRKTFDNACTQKIINLQKKFLPGLIFLVFAHAKKEQNVRQPISQTRGKASVFFSQL